MDLTLVDVGVKEGLVGLFRSGIRGFLTDGYGHWSSRAESALPIAGLCHFWPRESYGGW